MRLWLLVGGALCSTVRPPPVASTNAVALIRLDHSEHSQHPGLTRPNVSYAPIGCGRDAYCLNLSEIEIASYGSLLPTLGEVSCTAIRLG